MHPKAMDFPLGVFYNILSIKELSSDFCLILVQCTQNSVFAVKNVILVLPFIHFIQVQKANLLKISQCHKYPLNKGQNGAQIRGSRESNHW